MPRRSTYSAKELKVRTGEVLGRVAEGSVVYISHRGKPLARIEPVTASRTPAEVQRFLKAVADCHGCASGGATSVREFERVKHAEERVRDRRRGNTG